MSNTNVVLQIIRYYCLQKPHLFQFDSSLYFLTDTGININSHCDSLNLDQVIRKISQAEFIMTSLLWKANTLNLDQVIWMIICLTCPSWHHYYKRLTPWIWIRSSERSHKLSPSWHHHYEKQTPWRKCTQNRWRQPTTTTKFHHHCNLK